ncbi:MAG: hypothetical protein ACI9MR_003836 [Myxococcota bacterium]|jgi:hypothetical protein
MTFGRVFFGCSFDPAVREPHQPIIAQRRPRQVLAEALQAWPASRLDMDRSVDLETLGAPDAQRLSAAGPSGVGATIGGVRERDPSARRHVRTLYQDRVFELGVRVVVSRRPGSALRQTADSGSVPART